MSRKTFNITPGYTWCPRRQQFCDPDRCTCYEKPEPGKLEKLEKSTRPDWNEYFLDVAEAISKRATCPRKSVGAVIVDNNVIWASGYNGSPAGLPHCVDEGVGCHMVDGHCKRTIHAERNAILHLPEYFKAGSKTVLYCTLEPCEACRRFAWYRGITHFVWRDDYKEARL